MAKIEVQGVFCVRSRGREYWYHQLHRGTARQGARTALPGHPNSRGFWDALEALPAPRQGPRAGTFAALIAAYRESPEWRALAPSTTKLWELYQGEIATLWGDKLVKGLEPKHVLWLRDQRAATPASANNLIKTLSSMLGWSVPRGWRNDNPCREVPKLAIGEGYEPWPIETVDLFKADAHPVFWSAACLALYTGQRLGDCLAMPWHSIRDGVVRVRQSKTGKLLEIRLHARLQAELASMPRVATTILVNRAGVPWQTGFKGAWRKELARDVHSHIRSAGLVFHGLRKSAVVMLLEAGCSAAEVAAITGQSMQMVEHYAKGINQKRMADAAVLKWEKAG